MIGLQEAVEEWLHVAVHKAADKVVVTKIFCRVSAKSRILQIAIGQSLNIFAISIQGIEVILICSKITTTVIASKTALSAINNWNAAILYQNTLSCASDLNHNTSTWLIEEG